MSSYPLPGIKVDPQGQQVSVSITDDAGNVPTVTSDPNGQNTVSLPAVITAQTTFYVPNRGTYTVNGVYTVTVSGSQVASVTIPSQEGYKATVSSAAYNLIPTNGVIQQITLSPPVVSGLTYESNTVVITPASQASGWSADVTLLNDATGPRFFVFRNVTWIDNTPTPGGAAGTVCWSGRLFSPDGTAVYGYSFQPTQLQGIDPVSVPTLSGAWEANVEPVAPGTANAAMLARSGTAMTADTSYDASAVLPTLKSPAVTSAPLQPWERQYLPRAAFDCSPAHVAPKVAFVSGGTTAGFTLIAACYVNTVAQAHDAMLIELGNGASNVVGLVVATSGNAYWYYSNGSFDNLTAPAPIVGSNLAPAVISIIQPPGSGTFVCRINGVAATFGAITPTGTTDTLRIAHSVAGSGTFSASPSYFAGIWAFTEGLPFAFSSDPVPQIERYAKKLLGIAA